MPIPNDESPYRPPSKTPLRPSDELDPKSKPTRREKILVLLTGILVAVPVFFTTCLGGGFALFSFNIGTKGYGLTTGVTVFLWLVSIGIACAIGIFAALLVKRAYRKSRKSSSGKSK